MKSSYFNKMLIGLVLIFGLTLTASADQGKNESGKQGKGNKLITKTFQISRNIKPIAQS